jgi:hypothetical protein
MWPALNGSPFVSKMAQLSEISTTWIGVMFNPSLLIRLSANFSFEFCTIVAAGLQPANTKVVSRF